MSHATLNQDLKEDSILVSMGTHFHAKNDCCTQIINFQNPFGRALLKICDLKLGYHDKG